jgi:hypothetical protein
LTATIEIRVGKRRAEDVATDAAEAVDADLDGHGTFVSFLGSRFWVRDDVW